MANLRQTPLTCSGHTRPVVHLDFSEVTDSGYYLISACKDGKPMLRQGDTGDWIGTFEGHKGAVWGVALNSDATRAASGAADFTGKVWDAISGEELHSFQHNHIVKSVDFSKDSGLMVTGSNEKLVRIFDLNRTEASPEVFSGHTSGIRHVLFFRNDTHMVSCADDKTLRVWSRSTGTKYYATDSGKWYFTGRTGQGAKYFLYNSKLSLSTNVIYELGFVLEMIISKSFLSSMEIQKVEFNATPNSLEVSKDGSVLTVTYSNHIVFLDSESLTKIREFSIPSTVNSASLHPDKSIFVAGGDDLKVYKFDYTTGTEIESFKGHFGPVHCVKFSPDGELYASGSEDGTLRLWQTTVGKTYGLWKCVEGQLNNDPLSPPKEVQAN